MNELEPLKTSAYGPDAYPAQIDALLSKVSDTPEATECAFFDSLLDRDEARRIGADVESAAVLDACLETVESALPSIVAHKVSGYGPLRLHYLLKLSRTLADKIAALDAAVVEAAEAGAPPTTSLRGARELRRRAFRALKNLTSRGTDLRGRVRKAVKEDRPDERAHSLETLAKELEGLVAKVPPRVAADAGASPELMAGLRCYAKAVLDARTKAKTTNNSAFANYDSMNALDGHILYELRVLARSLRDAQKYDKSVPAVQIKLVKRQGRKKEKEPVVEVLKKTA